VGNHCACAKFDRYFAARGSKSRSDRTRLGGQPLGRCAEKTTKLVHLEEVKVAGWSHKRHRARLGPVEQLQDHSSNHEVRPYPVGSLVVSPSPF